MKYFRPLSKSMVQKLQQCRQKELNGTDQPCTMDNMNYAVAPLYKRGLIETKRRLVENKILLCIYVTEAGIELLDKLESV